MIDNDYKIPFYAKTTIFFVGLFALITMLYIAQSIIVPLVFAIIVAIVLHPVVNFFVRLHSNRVVAISISLLITIVLIAGLGILIYSQASTFSESWPVLVEKFTKAFNQSITWSSGYLDISPRKIHAWITETKSDFLNNSSSAIGQTLVGVGNALVILFLIPVYIFLILFYEPLLLDFIRKLFGEDNKSQVSEIVTKTKTVIQRYLIGLVIEAVIVAIMEIAALLILGIEYALLLGILGALLNVIPYIGGLVAVALPMMIALATKDSAWYAVYVLVIYYIIQLIDNNYIVPKIVASKVKINALFSIIVVIAGNALWGIPGMFLSIPLLAIVKLIFDHVEQLKPWGFLLGDTMPQILEIKHSGLKRIKKIINAKDK
ncbi:MAG: AI-2E family transporter [Bacteroidales bacterium]|nr:AI-2E family transporter [Bacteroidales bacterium]